MTTNRKGPLRFSKPRAMYYSNMGNTGKPLRVITRYVFHGKPAVNDGCSKRIINYASMD